jgi:hypothetical protein
VRLAALREGFAAKRWLRDARARIVSAWLAHESFLPHSFWVHVEWAAA